MKRFGILFLTFIINAVVVTQGIFPHHHHRGLPCFRNGIETNCCPDHCETEENTGCHGCTPKESSDNNPCCLFKQLLLLNNINEKEKQACGINIFHLQHPLVLYVSWAVSFHLPIPDRGKGIDLPTPYYIAYCSVAGNRISGLRAPPIQL